MSHHTRCMLRSCATWRSSHRSLLLRARVVGPVLSRRKFTMASEEVSLTQQIADQTALFNKLKLENSEPSLLEEAKKKLAELKKTLNLQKNASGDGKDAGKKKERLLLKTAKVRRQACVKSQLHSSQHLIRVHATMVPARCSFASRSNA